MLLRTRLTAAVLCGALILGGCAKKKPTAEQQVQQAEQQEESFLTLADVTGQQRLKADSPGVRVINMRAKALIKRGDILAAKKKAIELAAVQAIDAMTRELLDTETYNQSYEKIVKYMEKDTNKYIVTQEVNGEKKIFGDRYYGINASFKVNRQEVLKTLQRELKLINTSASTLIPVITSKKGSNLSKVGLRFSDFEQVFMKQIQTYLNQQGLRAMDFNNAVVSLQNDPKLRNKIKGYNKAKFLADISGSSSGSAALNKETKKADSLYQGGLTLLKELAKVVIEINVISLRGKLSDKVVMNLNVTATNISTGKGGAIANSIVTVGRQGGPGVDPGAIILGLVKDALDELKKKFIPQVIKEMSTVELDGNKLIPYQLVMKGFSKRDGSKIRRIAKGLQDNKFRFIEVDNSVKGITTLMVRFAGRPSDLGDKLTDALDGKFSVDEPIIAKGVNDLVFKRIAKAAQ